MFVLDDIFVLVIEAQRGQQDALEKLLNVFSGFRGSLYRLFASKGIDNDDVSQQIDLFFIESVMTYNPDKDPNPIRHILYKTKYDVWNYYRKEMGYFDDSKRVDLRDTIDAKSDIDIEEDVTDKVFVDSIMAKLTPRERDMLKDYFYNDMTQSDIALKNGINQSNVSRTINGSLDRIRERYRKHI